MAKSTKRGQRLVKAAKEALAIAKGEAEHQLARAPMDVDVKSIRDRLGLTQSEFAAKYRFSLARIRDWEQGRSRPDAAMRGYLMNIASGTAGALADGGSGSKGIRRVRITAHTIESWSNSRQAQELLPILLRRLIGGASDVTSIAMPGGDAVSVTGWDGIVTATKATPWVPEGKSFWELGTSGRPQNKADLDYQKRLKQTPEEVRASSTYVFLSSRMWPRKNEWIAEKAREGDWKDVRAYDALDLEQWLELSPTISIWFGEQLDMSGSGVLSVEEAWRTWSEQTDPPLTISTMLAKRSEAVQRLFKSIAGEQKSISVRADSVEEAVAVICACLLQDQNVDLAARALVVAGEEGWRFVDANSEIDLVIVARPELARDRAPNEHIKTFIPFAASDRGAFYRGRAASAADDGAIVFDRLRSMDFEHALKEIGIDEADAQRLSRLTSRSWTVFRRLRAKNDAIARPNWLEHSASKILTTVCLVGSWSGEREGDRDTVTRIAGRPYDEVERELKILATLDDAPVLAIGSVWRAKSPLELLHLVGDRITREELDRFFTTAQALLAAPDPILELPEKDRWMASIYKKVREQSGLIFGSICDALIKLAVLGPDVDNLAVQGIATRVSMLVKKLLGGANGERWLSLSNVLSELAEAAPAEFLNAIDKSLSESEPAVARLISETSNTGFMGGRCWYADLLRGLEVLAWQPQNLTRVVDVLVKLAKFPKAGNWVNSPANTLLSLFRSWLPQTAAPLDRRIELLDRVMYLDKSVAWDLLCNLVLVDSDTASPNARPKWRDDDAGAGYGTTQGEMHRMLVASAERLLTLANNNPSNIAHLIKEFDHFDPDRRTRIISMASEFAKDSADDKDRALLREAVREYIIFHKRYEVRSEQFAQDAAAVEDLYQKLEPKSLSANYAWLFKDAWLDLDDDIRKVSYEDQMARLQQKRVDAVREIRSSGGMQEIERFIAKAGDPAVVGSALAKVFENNEQIVDWVSTQSSKLDLASAIGRAVRGLMFSLGDARATVTRLVTDIALPLWRPDQLTNFYLVCPNDRTTWLQLERNNEAVQAAYWANVRPMMGTPADDINELARRMLAAKRPRSAFVSTQVFLEKVEPQLLYQMLDEMRTIPEEGINFPGSWQISQAFDRVEASGSVELRDLALVEFAYTRLLSHSQRGLKLLNRIIITDPTIFVELIKGAYKARNAPDEELSEQQKGFAGEAWTVLHNIKRVPGQRDDGSIDRDALIEWVTSARNLCREVDRKEAGDNVIGGFLSRAKEGADGLWPAEGIRDILELQDAEEIRHGFIIGTYNNRGVTSRSYDEGGAQERALAKKYEKYAEELSANYPRVSEMLRTIQKSYENDARREDLDAKLRIEGA